MKIRNLLSITFRPLRRSFAGRGIPIGILPLHYIFRRCGDWTTSDRTIRYGVGHLRGRARFRLQWNREVRHGRLGIVISLTVSTRSAMVCISCVANRGNQRGSAIGFGILLWRVIEFQIRHLTRVWFWNG